MQPIGRADVRKRQNAPSRKKPICGNTIGFAGAALSVLFALSLGWAGQAKPLPHPGPWPIQQGHNLQPRADQLKVMRKEDLTTQESLEVEARGKQPTDVKTSSRLSIGLSGAANPAPASMTDNERSIPEIIVRKRAQRR